MKRSLTTTTSSIALALLMGCSGSAPRTNPAGIPQRSQSSSVQLTDSSRYVGFSVPGFPPNPDRLVALEHATGVHATAVSFYMSLGKKLDIAAVSSLRSSGALPVVEIDSDKIPLGDIAAGAKDAILESYARQIASIHGAVAIDFDHEFNGPWFDWGYTHESARTFIEAWRHVIRIFRRNGATNVAWIWNPNVSGASTTAIRQWYPGNVWVTMVGLDGYFYTRRASFNAVFGQTLRQVRAFAHHPVIIVETGANPSTSRPAQIRNLFMEARKAHIVGIIWFDYHKYMGHNWLIDSDTAALIAFRKAAEAFK